MSDFDNTNRGVLFRNDKEGNEARPDYTGNINVDGRELRLAAWLKTSKAGNKFMSLSVSEPQHQQSAPQSAPSTDDIPF